MSKINPLDDAVRLEDIEKIIEKEENLFINYLQDQLTSNKSDSEDFFTSLNKEIISMVDILDRRIQYWENRRTQFLQIALGLLALSIAAIIAVLPIIQGNMYSGDSFNLFYFPLIISLIVLSIGGVKIIMLWNIQNNPDYPFTKSFRVWRWQYRYAELKGMEINTEIDRNDDFAFIEEAKKFQKNLLNYKERTVNSGLAGLLNQNISQLYLLITNEKYKIKFVSKLRDTLVLFLNLSIIVFFISIALCLIFRFC